MHAQVILPAGMPCAKPGAASATIAAVKATIKALIMVSERCTLNRGFRD
jgi:hypothetical protein